VAIGVILFKTRKASKKREELPMAESTMPGMDVIRKQLVDADGDL
jgi:hypothetical protein